MGNLFELQRVPARLPALVTLGQRIEHYFTAQVGLRGVFILCQKPSPVQQLMTVTLTLPEGQLFEVQGFVSRTVTAIEAKETGIPAGMGIQFYGMSTIVSRRWEDFLHRALDRIKSGDSPIGWDAFHSTGEEGPPEAGQPSSLSADPPGTEMERPQHASLENQGLVPKVRALAVLYNLALSSVEQLYEFAENALPAGGVFIRTKDVRPAGTPAVVCVIHPITRTEFHLPGEVLATPEGRRGVGVRLLGANARTQDHFKSFIARGIPESEMTGVGQPDVETGLDAERRSGFDDDDLMPTTTRWVIKDDDADSVESESTIELEADEVELEVDSVEPEVDGVEPEVDSLSPELKTAEKDSLDHYSLDQYSPEEGSLELDSLELDSLELDSLELDFPEKPSLAFEFEPLRIEVEQQDEQLDDDDGIISIEIKARDDLEL